GAARGAHFGRGRKSPALHQAPHATRAARERLRRSMRGLILSAGMGERLRPLTLTRAKPAIEFLNMPMLAYPYYWLDTVDLSNVVFNTHYLPETVRKAAMHVVRPECQTHFSHEDTILGSGGGIWNARF